jgi:hypothetical protein
MTPEEILQIEMQKHPTLTRKEWYNGVYLKSDHWKELRELALSIHGRKCAKCPARKPLHVHHLRYKNIFDVTVTDLQILCEACHKNEHPEYNKHKKSKRIKVKKPKKAKRKNTTRIDLVSELGRWEHSFRRHPIPEASAIRHVMRTMGWLISKQDRRRLRLRRIELESAPPPDHPMVNESLSLEAAFLAALK